MRTENTNVIYNKNAQVALLVNDVKEFQEFFKHINTLTELGVPFSVWKTEKPNGETGHILKVAFNTLTMKAELTYPDVELLTVNDNIYTEIEKTQTVIIPSPKKVVKLIDALKDFIKDELKQDNIVFEVIDSDYKLLSIHDSKGLTNFYTLLTYDEERNELETIRNDVIEQTKVFSFQLSKAEISTILKAIKTLEVEEAIELGIEPDMNNEGISLFVQIGNPLSTEFSKVYLLKGVKEPTFSQLIDEFFGESVGGDNVYVRLKPFIDEKEEEREYISILFNKGEFTKALEVMKSFEQIEVVLLNFGIVVLRTLDENYKIALMPEEQG